MDFFQSTELANSYYQMSMLTRKAVYILSNLIKCVNKQYITTIYYPELCKLLSISLTDTRQKNKLLKGLKELTSRVITFGTPSANLNHDFQFCSWVQSVDYNTQDKIIRIVWTDCIASMFYNVQSNFSKINIDTILSFKSFYALRLYELCLSKIGFSGKQGNYKNTWFLQLSAKEIDACFFRDSKISFGEKIRIIKRAVKEVNKKAGFSCELMPPSSGNRYNRNELFLFSCEKNIEKEIEKRKAAPEKMLLLDSVEKTFQNVYRLPAVKEYYDNLILNKDDLTFEATLKRQTLEKFGFI